MADKIAEAEPLDLVLQRQRALLLYFVSLLEVRFNIIARRW
jgi:hypothetical protein